jgi:hypothetical protein
MGVHSTTELLTIAGMHSTHSCSGKDMGRWHRDSS